MSLDFYILINYKNIDNYKAAVHGVLLMYSNEFLTCLYALPSLTIPFVLLQKDNQFHPTAAQQQSF